MTVLTQAHREWASRAPDERFSSVKSLHEAALGYKTRAKRAEGVPTSKLRVIESNGDIKLAASKEEIDLTNWSFGQLATAADAPAAYLQRLPAKLAVENLNHGLKSAAADRDRPNRLLFDRAESGMATLRALTSTRYARIWNSDITKRLVELEEQGPWQPAPAAFDGSRGLYLGDRDMFAFMVDNDRRIFETAPGGGLSRGFFVKNSEVGAASFAFCSFLFEFICGNHRVWGVSEVKEVKIRHVGEAGTAAFEGLEAELIKYSNASAHEDELKIERMRRYKVGKDLDEILDTVMGLRIGGITRKVVEESFEIATRYEDWYGAPTHMWGLTGGMTQVARDLPNADARATLEAATGKLMEVAF